MSETNNQIKFQEMLSALKNEIRETGLKLEGEDELTVEVVVQELQAQLEMKSSKLTRLMRLNTIVSPEVGFQSVPSDALPAPITVDQFTVVPVGLPLFQWKGQVKDEKHEVFADIEECLGRFEDVLRQHTLDFNLHWYRLLPPCLPSELREWLTKYIKVYEGSVAWSTLRTAITARYGVPKEQLQFERIREFLKCKKTASESIDGFLTRFKTLKTKAAVQNKTIVAMVFFDAFTKDTVRLLAWTKHSLLLLCFLSLPSRPW